MDAARRTRQPGVALGHDHPRRLLRLRRLRRHRRPHHPAIEADFEKAGSKDPAHYAVKVVYPSGKLVEYGINADTGAVYKTENQPIERYFTRLKPADFQNAKTSLKDALAIAEQKAGGGKAYEAEVSKDGSSVQYKIEVAGADKEHKVKVGGDGKVVD